jgi:hypothetical protein
MFADVLGEAKKSLNFHWRIIWDNQLWAQSRFEQELDTVSGVADYDLNGQCGIVVGVRSGEEALIGVGDSFAMQTAPDRLYSQSGRPRYFLVLPRGGSGPKIRLLPTPDGVQALHVIGKKRFAQLGDADEPSITGAEQVLLFLVTGDLYKMMRQNAKAQAEYSAGMAHLQKMVEIEQQQQQTIHRIVPDVSCYESDYGGVSFP